MPCMYKFNCCVTAIYKKLKMWFTPYGHRQWTFENNRPACIVVVSIGTKLNIEHCENLPGSFDECSSKRHMAADLWTKPIDRLDP